jgi:excisionase family DNA binding protein
VGGVLRGADAPAGPRGSSMSPRTPRPVPMGVMRSRTTTRHAVVRTALAAPPVERQTYTVEEPANLLGISRSTAYECVRDGSLPALHFRKRVVITGSTVDALLERVRSASSATMHIYRRGRFMIAAFFSRFGPASYQRRSVSSLLPVIEATVR